MKILLVVYPVGAAVTFLGVLFLFGALFALGRGEAEKGFWPFAFLVAIIGGALWPITLVIVAWFMPIGNFLGGGPWFLWTAIRELWNRLRWR